jgi:oxygen-dependent protoporphyrinogen oxidase
MLTVVVGGGISGLVCAYELRQLGLPVLLLEASDRVGGVIDSVQQDGFLFELGPQSVLSSDSLLDLVGHLGIAESLVKADPRAPRYILLRGRLHPVPMAPPALLTTSLLGVGSKLRLLSEPFRKSTPPESDESIAAFVRRKFGAELLENLVGPFVSGVYAGDPEKLSLRSAFPALHAFEEKYGSVIRGGMKFRPPKDKPRPTLCAFRDGLATLVRSLREQLGNTVLTGASVESVSRGKTNGSSHFEIQVRRAGRTEAMLADSLVLAAPARAASRILAGLSEGFESLLGRIEYAAVAVVSAGYKREQVGHPLAGFGFLAPRKEGRRLLGTVWSSSLFAGRAPEGMVSIATFAGGATDPQLFQLADDEIAAAVEKENAEILQISGPPATRMAHRWIHAIPQYNLGHSQILAGLREEVARFPGLFLTGSYLEGPSVPACIDHATKTAKSAHEHITSVQPGLARGASR